MERRFLHFSAAKSALRLAELHLAEQLEFKLPSPGAGRIHFLGAKLQSKMMPMQFVKGASKAIIVSRLILIFAPKRD